MRRNNDNVKCGVSLAAAQTLGSWADQVGFGGSGRRWTGVCRKAVLWETFQQWEDREERVQRPRGVRAGCRQRCTEHTTVAGMGVSVRKLEGQFPSNHPGSEPR